MNIKLFVVVEGTWIVFRTFDSERAMEYAQDLGKHSRHSVSVREVSLDLDQGKVEQFILAV